MKRLLLLASLPLAAARAAAPAPSPATPPPPLYVIALPAAYSFIAWLPVEKAPAAVDLDLRVEVVQPMDCGDRIAGLLRPGGPRLDRPGALHPGVARQAGGRGRQAAKRIRHRGLVLRPPHGRPP